MKCLNLAPGVFLEGWKGSIFKIDIIKVYIFACTAPLKVSFSCLLLAVKPDILDRLLADKKAQIEASQKEKESKEAKTAETSKSLATSSATGTTSTPITSLAQARGARSELQSIRAELQAAAAAAAMVDVEVWVVLIYADLVRYSVFHCYLIVFFW